MKGHVTDTSSLQLLSDREILLKPHLNCLHFYPVLVHVQKPIICSISYQTLTVIFCEICTFNKTIIQYIM